MIYLWEKERAHFIDEVETYTEQVRLRLFDSFREVEKEAEEESEKYLDAYNEYYGEHGDPAEAYEGAYDRYIDYQLRMFDLTRELYLTALSGLYFMWDRQLKSFFERELRYYFRREHMEKELWGLSALDTLKNMRKFGLKYNEFKDIRNIEKLSLVVNVHKHGKGPSLKKLQSEFGKDFDSIWGSQIEPGDLDERSLFISEEDFFAYSECLKEFWREFPENLPPTP